VVGGYEDAIVGLGKAKEERQLVALSRASRIDSESFTDQGISLTLLHNAPE